MKILFNNNIYQYENATINFTVDLGKTSVGIPVAVRLWITDTIDDINQSVAIWESDGSEHIIAAKLIDDDCWHDHANNIIHGTRIVSILSEDDDQLEISHDLQLATPDTDDSVSSLQPINVILTSSIDDIGTTHQRTLIIYGENPTRVYAKITFIGETISEDMDIAAQAELQGFHMSPDDCFVFREADPNEPVFSSELLNRKRKEYLLCIDKLKDKLGTTDGMMDAIRFFGYDDMYIGTLWKISNNDSPYYEGYSIRYRDVNNTPNTLDDNDIHYQQVNRAVLVYKLVKTLDIPFDKVPYTAEVNSYGVDGNSVKLARLKDVMNDQFMPAAIPIKEILGECDVYYAAKTIHRAWDNLTEYDYSEQNIKLSIAKKDIYEFRLSRYYALVSKLFSQEFIEKVYRAEKNCNPNSYEGCLLYRLKRVYTIYEFIKSKKEFDEPDVVVWKGGDGENISVSYLVYLLTTPKVNGVTNFIADTYSGIHSEAITIMMYLYDECDRLTDKLHTDAKEFPDYLWTIWQETSQYTSAPIDRNIPEDGYNLNGLWDGLFVDRYCSFINVSLSCQDTFRYKWNDIHSWWNHTYRSVDDTGEFRDGMTWVNTASIFKIEWTIFKHDDHNIKYTYVCEKHDPSESIPHIDTEGVIDYDIYGVPVTAAMIVYHWGEYDVEAIIYDNFGHIDRLYKENAIHVHPSKQYLTGIAQNVVRDVISKTEDSIDTERGEDAINRYCNSFIYGPMRYNRVFDNANGLLFKLPYFPKIVDKNTFYYLYPFTISNAIDANERYSYTDARGTKESSPFSLPNIIPSQPTALILPLNTNTVHPYLTDADAFIEEYERSGSCEYKDQMYTDDIKLGNTGRTVKADTIVAIKDSLLYVYNMPYDSEGKIETDRVLNDLNTLTFWKDYKWQITYMPYDKYKHIPPKPILMGIARNITKDTDIDAIYLANNAYIEYMDIMKEESPLHYSISYVSNIYNFIMCDGETEISISEYTYPQAIAWIKDKYAKEDKMFYIKNTEIIYNSDEKDIPRIIGTVYDAFIGMPHYGNWTFIAGGYAKLKKFSWVVVSIDNNNIPGKHNIVWDIERRSILRDPKDIKTAVGTIWESELSDASFKLINNISREDYEKGEYDNNNFPSAYLPYMFSKIGQYRISCSFMDINGDYYKTPYVIIDIE